MNKQKIAELAKELEGLIEQDGTRDAVVSIDVYKGVDGYVRTTANVAHFFGNGDNSIILRRQIEEIDGVEVTHRFYQAVGDEFDFVCEWDPNQVYHAKKQNKLYVVTWGDCTVDYTEDFVEKCIRNGEWIVINKEV